MEIHNKEYVDQEIRHLRRERRLERILTERALKMQAVEYERRLQNLNHEHDRAKEALQKTVSREKYDADQETLEGRLQSVRDQVLIEASSKDTIWRVGMVLLVVVGWVVNWVLSR